MRRLALVLAVVGCGHPGAAPGAAAPERSAVPRLLPPLPADPAARGAAYLNQVALQLQPGWGQFLDDCRLRLPARHALNTMSLVATADITANRRGAVTKVDVTPSGNTDFDEAVRDAIRDAAPLAAPPLELLSDDDQVHLRWLFARDRRQAGPATAEVRFIELPVGPVIDRLLAERDLARAARRVLRAPGSERTAPIERITTAALREALASADSASRRAAVEAIGRARVKELAPDVRGLLASTTDTELRLVAIDAALALEDSAAARPLLAQLPGDLPDHPRLALAETRALVGLGHRDEAAAVLAQDLAGQGAPHPIALSALAVAPVPALAGKLAAWMQHGDARIRLGVCAALAGADTRTAATWLARGLTDADASVRVACADAAAARAGGRGSLAFVPRLRELVHDRDRTVRAHALAAIAALDPAHVVNAIDDPAGEVRLAFAAALATALPSEAEADLRQLIDDRDADVRAAAWTSLVALPRADRAALAARAVRDAASSVRRAALPALDDDTVLARIATSDDSLEVRTAATVALAGRRGRAASERDLLEQLAAAPAGSPERVRTALAWLLAR